MLKRFLPNTLFGRALAIIITPVILLQVVATYVFYERHWNSVTRRLALGLAGDIAVIIDIQRESPKMELPPGMTIKLRRSMQIETSYVAGEILPNTPLTASVANRILDSMLDQALSERLVLPYRIDTTSYGEKIEVRVQLVDGVVRFLTPRKRVSSPTTYIFVMWMVGASLILLAIAILFLRNQIKPIRRLAEAADDFGKGIGTLELKPAGAAEVRQAAAAFLRMRDRISRHVEQRTEMLAGVSHDLRTPLTRMKLQLAMFEDTDKSAEVANLKADVSDMERMVEGYLDFARGQDAEATAKTDIEKLLGDVVAGARRDGGAIKFEFTPVPAEASPFIAYVRPLGLKRCLTNLLNNARRHAENISVALARNGDYLEIAIDDDGPGIPEHQRGEVFRPFRRLDESRNLDTAGTGLGLSVARDVARSHGGDIILSQAPAGGLRALVRLPA